VVKATGVVKLESLVEPTKHRFGRLAERNINAMKKPTRIQRWRKEFDQG